MEITFNSPALLFPAISLLLLAYTNRYLAMANLIRNLAIDGAVVSLAQLDEHASTLAH
mgnify:CR=1 FL=1